MNSKDSRPDPDTLLQKLHKENRGRLTIFLGAAAGVGKTYAMLEASRDRLNEGKNLVAGWVETHGRAETERLLEGLPILEPRKIEYRNKPWDEMDLDQILLRKPDIILVDELAHTNIPGSKHVRRFQDVEEILEAGIDVYTTLNIQHIESLNDVVTQITGIAVRETVPDRIVEKADVVRLIDIPPEELITRLKDGKVYIPDQASKALQKFFRAGNINALRELSLRYTARRVDDELQDYMRENRIDGPWPASGRVMVCVGHSPFSAQLIRAAHRLATGLQSELLALHIEPASRSIESDSADNNRISMNFRLAEDLGAKTITAVADNIYNEIIDIARKQNVTAIVVGRPQRSFFREWFKPSMVDHLIRQSEGLHIYVISATAESSSPPIKTRSSPQKPVWTQYALGIFLSIAFTAFSWFFRNTFELVNIALLYQIPVTLSAFWWGRWPSYITAIFSVAAFDFLFIPPIFTFTVDDIRYLWSFLSFLIVAFVIGGRTDSLRVVANTAKQRERSTRALYEFSREIAAVIDTKMIAARLASQAAETIGKPIVVLLPGIDGKLASEVQQENDEFAADPGEMAVAGWAFEHAEFAGRSTDTLPGAKYLYVPLKTRDSVNGVFCIRLAEDRITLEERRLIDAWAGLAAIAFERARLAEKARETSLLIESERLHTALFNSVSHDLRTPLASITGAASSLLETSTVYSERDKRELLETIQEGAVRMERVVANLLDTARLESGTMQLKNDWCEIEDIVGSAIRRLGSTVNSYKLRINLHPDLPFFHADCVLIEQVLINLIDNAIKYSPPASEILIDAAYDKQWITISVADQGSGIPTADLSRVFDKFFRTARTSTTMGTGLGLSICKAIVEAHGGRIWAESGSEGGSIFRFTLPIAAEPMKMPLEVEDIDAG